MTIPENWLECDFHLKNDEYFTVDYDNVTVEYVDPEDDFRHDKIKQWVIENSIYQEVVDETEVKSVMVVVKDEKRDQVSALPEPIEPGEVADDSDKQ